MQAYDIAITGAGVMGAAAACEAARRGVKVALIDQAQLPNPRAASFDHSKVFRFSYADPLYAQMAVDAAKRWRELEEETSARLLTPTGLLLIGQTRPSFESEVYETLRSLGLEADMLTSEQATARFPQFNADAFNYAVFDPSGAVLHAESAVRAMIELARRRGVSVLEGERVTAIKQEKPGGAVEIFFESGSKVACAQAVIATGPWTRKLLPELAGKLTTTRQEVVYFEPREGCKPGFDVGRFPIFIELETGFYGFPAHHEGAIKIANHHKGIPVDPLSVDERVSDEMIAQCRAFFTEFIPQLADARVLKTRVCLYNNTPDDDFIIDWHPGFDNILIVTGFSGHGFKFGPTIGRISAELLLSGRASYAVERFSLARFDNL